MTAPLTLRAGRTLSRESPLTGGVVTLYKITPEGRPDVAIGSVMNVELASLIVEAVNAGVPTMAAPSARDALLALAAEFDVLFEHARSEYFKDAYWNAARLARSRADSFPEPHPESGTAHPVTGESGGRGEELGRLVREVWVTWAREQPGVSSRSSWLLPWERLDDGQREAHIQIGLAVAAAERERIVQLARDLMVWCPGSRIRPGAAEPGRWFADFIRSLP